MKSLLMHPNDSTETLTKSESLQYSTNFSNLKHNSNSHIVLSPTPGWHLPYLVFQQKRQLTLHTIEMSSLCSHLSNFKTTESLDFHLQSEYPTYTVQLWLIKHHTRYHQEGPYPQHSTPPDLKWLLKRVQKVPHIVHHFWGTRDKLTIKFGILLWEIEYISLQNCMRGPLATCMTTIKALRKCRFDTDITHYVKQCTICTKFKVTQTVQPMSPETSLSDLGKS